MERDWEVGAEGEEGGTGRKGVERKVSAIGADGDGGEKRGQRWDEPRRTLCLCKSGTAPDGGGDGFEDVELGAVLRSRSESGRRDVSEADSAQTK